MVVFRKGTPPAEIRRILEQLGASEKTPAAINKNVPDDSTQTSTPTVAPSRRVAVKRERRPMRRAKSRPISRTSARSRSASRSTSAEPRSIVAASAQRSASPLGSPKKRHSRYNLRNTPARQQFARRNSQSARRSH